MGDVYILSDYGKLTKQGECFLYKDSNNCERKIRPFNTEMIVFAGKTSISADAFSMLSANQIPVFFIQKGSQNNIRLDYGESKNIFLRKRQYAILDGKESFEIAKTIVAGKIKNQLTFIQRIKRKKEDITLEKNVERINKIAKNIEKCTEISKLRGYEGLAAKYYFEAFSKNIIPKWAVFKSRSQRPPRSNVNAGLSYLYTILTCKVQAALESYGLDTMCGNLHELSYGKATLAFDLVEEFRVPFADAICCSLFNLNVLKEDDFEEKNEGIFMTREGVSKTIQHIEKKLEKEIYVEEAQRNLSWNQLFFFQAKVYKETILGERSCYVPFQYK